MPDRLGWRRQPCLCLDGSIVVLLMSELCKTLEYEFLDPPNASVVQLAQCRTGLPLRSIYLLSWFNSMHSSLIHQFESQPYHCSASQLCCCAASSPFKSFPVLGKRLCPFGEDIFLAMSPHTASQKYSFDWRHVSFPPSSPSLQSSARPSTVTIFPKHGQQRRTLVDKSTLWRAPPAYVPLNLLTKQQTAQSQSGRRSAPSLSSFERWREHRTVKIPTHHRIATVIFFSFDAPSSRTLKVKKSSPSLFSSSMPPPESGSPLTLVGFAVFNRRVMQLASRGGCDRARAGSSLGDFEWSFFFCIFGKSYARGRRETKKIITVA